MQSKVNLICGDCLEEMRKMEDNSIDLILCDMPYGITQHKDDKVIPLNEMWKEVKRIVKPTTPILFFASGLFYVDLVSSNRKMFKYDLVWDKGLTSGFLNAKRMPLRQHEHIAVFYEKLGCYNPQFTQGKPLHGKGSGTCGVAAVNTCRNFIGIEIDKDYYNLCNVRIKEKSDKITDND